MPRRSLKDDAQAYDDRQAYVDSVRSFSRLLLSKPQDAGEGEAYILML